LSKVVSLLKILDKFNKKVYKGPKRPQNVHRYV